MGASEPSVLHFGVFDLDAKSSELRRAGAQVKLPPQPFKVLALLAGRAGQLVTREEIQQVVWGNETFVDFEQGLNFCINQIRGALGDDAETPRYIETLPRRGYRFIAPVEELISAGPATATSASLEAGPPSAAQRTARRHHLRFMAIALAGILLLVSYFSWQRFHPASPPAGKVMLVVLPFENLSGDPQQEYFSDGLTEEMIMQLSRLNPERLAVIARTSAMQYKRTKKSAAEIGKELGVGYILESSFRRHGDRVRISAQLIQVKDQTHVWAENYERDLGDVLALQSDVAQAIAGEIEIKLTPQRQSILASSHRMDPEVHELYLKGRYFWNKRTEEGLQRAIPLFQQAIEKDPQYALAYAGLADAFILLGPSNVRPPKGLYPKAMALALKAVELDPTLAEAYASLAFATLLYDWNAAKAETSFQRAIELNPNYATAHHWYAYALASVGRQGEAVREIKQAHELDPLSLSINADLAQLLFFAGRYDEALEQCRKTLDIDPEFAPAYWYLGLLHWQKGMEEQAVAAFFAQTRLSGRGTGVIKRLETAFGAGGMKGYWREQIRIWQERPRELRPSPFNLAVAYALASEKDQALKNLETAYRDHHPSMVFVGVDPVFSNLRSDPRFQKLLRRVGLP